MSDPIYRLGDRVRVTYEGVIDKVDKGDPHRFGFRVGQFDTEYFRTDDATTRHELVAAAEWPPIPGDTWTDSTGKDWLAHATEDNGYGIGLTSEFGARFEDKDGIKTADQLYGPFRLKTPGKRRLERPERPC
ncbi:hypothetical protein [Nonomuraea sp. CA-141351]|uniref:hypothetical protein n=1 Tax=Nonomuraea sp. CA-141351 TaxID=3239996 RepID=UPI003D91CC82